jgi:hypothetical protein
MKRFAMGIVAALGVTSALAADLKALVYKAPSAPALGAWYGWADGMYESINLPASGLGLQATTGTLPFTRLGPFQPLPTQLDGAGFRAGVGYATPNGYRFEVGGSYLRATRGANYAVGPFTGTGVTSISAGGFVPPVGGFTCTFVGITCTVGGSDSRSFDAWQVNGKASYDWRMGATTLTPHVAIFGGESRDRQNFSQVVTDTIAGLGITRTGSYTGAARLNWDDVGVRVGLDADMPVFGPISWEGKGWIGGARRRADLSVADTVQFVATPTTSSVLLTSATTGTFLANAETGFAYKFTPSMKIRAFGGLNYDSRVPGITAPALGQASIVMPASVSTIYFKDEVSYYAGGGGTIRF